jgi:hypothetical protein
MNTNSCLPPAQAAARVRRLAAWSMVAWSGMVLAAWVGLSGAVAGFWALAATAFCAGAGIAFAYRRYEVRASVAGSDPAPPPLARMPFIGLGVWQEIDRNRDLLHLLKEKTRPRADTVRFPVAPSPEPQFAYTDRDDQ